MLFLMLLVLAVYSMYSVYSSHPGMITDVPIFKPKCCKLFRFPVFLLSNIPGGFSSKLDELQVLFNDNNRYSCLN